MSAATSMPSTDRPFEDDDWDLLIGDIEQGNVVPVVGPALLIRGAETDCTLQQHLAAELVRRLGAGLNRLPPDRTLIDICSQIPDRRRMCDGIRKALDTSRWPIPVPLLQLAGIGGFDLYVGTTFDTLLYQAVKQVRVGAEERIYGLKRPIEDIAPEGPAAPVVFQVFGRIDGVGDCALSEEEILEFTQRLLDADYRPQQIFDLMARRNLLFLGCDFPGWLGRLLRRVLRVAGDLRDSGLFAQSNFQNDPSYVLFLERQGTKLWLRDSGVQFVDELYRRWTAKHPAGESASVFISYAREDQDIARKLKTLFEALGVSVWFDRAELQSGEIWNDEIETAIESARIFVPVISRHSDRVKERFCHREWDLAGGMPGKRLCPLLTDFTKLPVEFSASHARTLAEIEDLVNDVKQFLEKTV